MVGARRKVVCKMGSVRRAACLLIPHLTSLAYVPPLLLLPLLLKTRLIMAAMRARSLWSEPANGIRCKVQGEL